MDIIGTLISGIGAFLFGASTSESAHARECAKRNAQLEQAIQNKTGRKPYSYSHVQEQKLELQKELTRLINEGGVTLNKLYSLIDWQYTSEPLTYVKHDSIFTPVTFSEMQAVPRAGFLPSYDGKPSDGIELIATRTYASGVEDGHAEFVTRQVHQCLQIVRLQYWKPNRKRFMEWWGHFYKEEGLTKESIRKVIYGPIPVTDITNDVHRRTPEEIAYFDRVAARIEAISYAMTEAIENLQRLNANTMLTSDMTREMGMLTPAEYINAVYDVKE